MPALTDGYLQWCLGREEKCFREHFKELSVNKVLFIDGQCLITVVDIFCESLFGIPRFQLTAKA